MLAFRLEILYLIMNTENCGFHYNCDLTDSEIKGMNEYSVDTC